MLTITTALYAGSVNHVLYSYRAWYNPYPLWGLYSISAQWLWKIVLLTLAVFRGVTDLYPSWWNILHARTILCVKLSFNNHIVGLVHKKHIIVRTCLMYHAACKVYFQPLKQIVLIADVFQISSFSIYFVINITPIGRIHSWRFSMFF